MCCSTGNGGASTWASPDGTVVVVSGGGGVVAAIDVSTPSRAARTARGERLRSHPQECAPKAIGRSDPVNAAGPLGKRTSRRPSGPDVPTGSSKETDTVPVTSFGHSAASRTATCWRRTSSRLSTVWRSSVAPPVANALAERHVPDAGHRDPEQRRHQDEEPAPPARAERSDGDRLGRAAHVEADEQLRWCRRQVDVGGASFSLHEPAFAAVDDRPRGRRSERRDRGCDEDHHGGHGDRAPRTGASAMHLATRQGGWRGRSHDRRRCDRRHSGRRVANRVAHAELR